MEKKGIIIAIDGPAGSGKSTTAKLVASRLNYIYIDTGAMYRAVTLYYIKNNLPIDEASICKYLDNIDVSLDYKDNTQQTFLNGVNVSEEIRLPEVTKLVSPVSAIDCVRKKMVELQRNIGKQGAVVLDGRDIGTVVFPEAELKIFLVASLEERARRRFLELKAKNINVDMEKLLQQIAERDKYDSTRKNSPLKKADDAIEIDTTNLTIDEQVEKIIELAKNIIEKKL